MPLLAYALLTSPKSFLVWHLNRYAAQFGVVRAKVRKGKKTKVNSHLEYTEQILTAVLAQYDDDEMVNHLNEARGRDAVTNETIK